LQRQLQASEFFVQVEDSPEAKVYPQAQAVLRDLKTELLRSIESAFPSVVDAPDPTAALRERLVAMGLEWAGDKWEDGVVDGEVAALPQHRERWMAITCVLLAPGSDCMLSVYERRQGQMKTVLVLRNDGYATITGAVHALSVVASPPDARDRFYVLEAHTFPWPSSRWRQFTYRAFAPGPTPEAPGFLGGASAYGDWMNGFDLKAQEGSFSVGFNVMSERLPDLAAPVVHRWKRSGGRFVPATAGVQQLARDKAFPNVDTAK
jgi:hypothetical protein